MPSANRTSTPIAVDCEAVIALRRSEHPGSTEIRVERVDTDGPGLGGSP